MKAVDTSFLIDLLRGEPGAVGKAGELDESGGAVTTAMNIFEIVYGIYRSGRLDRDRRLVDVERLVSRMYVLPLDARSAVEAGKILGALSREGKIIDLNDGIIGAIVKVNGMETMVTRNVEHFNRIPNLKVETY